jgi:hypothetical protein
MRKGLAKVEIKKNEISTNPTKRTVLIFLLHFFDQTK